MKLATLNKRLKRIGLVLVIDYDDRHREVPTYIHLMWLSTYNGFVADYKKLIDFRKRRRAKHERT